MDRHPGHEDRLFGWENEAVAVGTKKEQKTATTRGVARGEHRILRSERELRGGLKTEFGFWIWILDLDGRGQKEPDLFRAEAW